MKLNIAANAAVILTIYRMRSFMSKNHNTTVPVTSPPNSDAGHADERILPPEVELSAKQLKAVLALAEGKTETETARLINVNRTTIYRWQQRATFVAEINRMKQEHVTQYRAKIRNLNAKAIKTIEWYLDRESDHPLNLRASMFVLRNTTRASQELVGPTTAAAVEKQWKREAILDELASAMIKLGRTDNRDSQASSDTIFDRRPRPGPSAFSEK